MLTQPTERDKLDAAVQFRAPVYLILVYRTLQVLVEPRERQERPVAQEALVRIPIPRPLRCPRDRRRRRLGATKGTSEEARRVRDVVVRICTDDEAVELLASHAGRAGARLEMEHERGVRDEDPVAAAAGAAYVGRPMDLRVKMLVEAGFALEGPLTVGTIVMIVAIVFLELCVGVEWLFVFPAGNVIGTL